MRRYVPDRERSLRHLRTREQWIALYREACGCSEQEATADVQKGLADKKLVPHEMIVDGQEVVLFGARGMNVFYDILYSPPAVEQWLASVSGKPATESRRGPKAGGTGYAKADRALFPEIKQRAVSARSARTVIQAMAKEGRVAGAGGVDARAERLYRRYLSESG
jgi:hypothetical protein